MNSTNKKIRIAITTGDADGIGYEVTSKALSLLKPSPNIEFYIYRSPMALSVHQNRLKKSKHTVYEIIRKDNPAIWFKEALKKCNVHEYDGVVTGPLSKKTIQKKYPKMGGHTDFLKATFGKNLIMTFLGQHMNVLLATDHISLKAVPTQIREARLRQCLFEAQKLNKTLKSRKKIGLLGLNPHAGEIPKLGKEEKSIFSKVFLWAKKQKISVAGPLVPDVAFQPEKIKQHSVFIAMYHDQGLIPFKMLHTKNHGAQITLGLPFVRTSVDHGTAKDIFMKNCANPSSMKEALSKAIYFIHQNR